VFLPAFVLDFGVPFLVSLAPRDALMSGCVMAWNSLVVLVLSIRRWPQKLFPIIPWVSISMVYHLSLWLAHYKSVQLERPSFAVT
jgi:hypothetical protein